MKKILGLSLCLSLTLLTAGSALAAVHDFNSDFNNPFLQGDHYSAPFFEGWYYIDKGSPHATFGGSFADDENRLGAQYLLNDQTFANITYGDYDDDSGLTLKGSYLFSNNVFAGVFLDSMSGDTQIIVSPGYRYNLNKNAYVAASLDYALTDELGAADSGIADLEVYGRYYNKVSRLYGQLIIPNEDVVGDGAKTYFSVGGAYKYNNNVILGGAFTQKQGDSTIELGCSTNFDRLGAEFRFESAESNDTIDLNVLYWFTRNIRAGLQLTDEDRDDLRLIVKGRYTVDNKNSVILAHQFENDSYPSSVTHLVWSMNL